MLGAVHIAVSDLERSLSYYQTSLGFKVHRRAGSTAYLGAGGVDLLVLTEQPNAKPLQRWTGLYHFAILVPSRLELAQVLRRLIETRTPLGGFADHLVSEAIYLNDPDGNGIEIYRDRPRTDWYDKNGRFVMGTEQLDIDGVLAELKNASGAWAGLAPDTVLGHMHLKVASISDAKAFYVGVLGFDVMASMGSALFLSAGGYHHHLGMNIWESANAPAAPADAVGLREFVVNLRSQAELDKVLARIQAANLPIEQHTQGYLVRDPSQNAVILTAGS
ncbi:MAG: VOC family protein [Anaerolineae bacterium]|nr:VOC family protein [Anaerolineae bacterium]